MGYFFSSKLSNESVKLNIKIMKNHFKERAIIKFDKKKLFKAK